MTMETKNAVITDVSITSDDHGFLSAELTLDYGRRNQRFVWHALYLQKSFEMHKQESNLVGYFLWRVMLTAGVTQWNDLIGKAIRVKVKDNDVYSIGHIVKNEWFCPSKEFKRYE